MSDNLSIKMRMHSGFCLLALVALSTGCDRESGGSSSTAGPAKIEIFASVYPLAEMAKRVGAGRVEVQWAVESGQRADEIEASMELRKRAGRCALVITSGAWDGWAGAELTREARERRLIEPQRTPRGRAGDVNAYLWLDAGVIGDVVEALRERLSLLDTDHQADYRRNAQAYLDEVNAVDREMREGLKALAGRKALAMRPVWGAMLARYGIEALTPPPKPEGTKADDLRWLAQAAKANRIRSIFVDVGTAAGVRQEIEEKTEVKVLTLDAVGNSAADGRNTWAKVMRYNLEQIKKGLE